jgi:putative DNA primase/helicase
VSDLPEQNPSQSMASFTDDGNALELVKTYGDKIRYCPERGRWLIWTGKRWEWCPATGGDVREYCKELARALTEDCKQEISHKRRSLSAAGTTAAMTMAATDQCIVVRLDDLDARPYELNTPGGILDLRTGTLTDSDPAALHTRITACTPDSSKSKKMWTDFLNDTFGKDKALIGYIQRLAGYSAIGEVREHILPFGYGDGQNGKSVLLEALQGVLGDYATTAPGGFLTVSKFPAHDTEIARLAGRRLVICSESQEDDQFDEEKVKRLTGGDTLTARFMRQDHFSFTPTHKIWLVANHKPAVRSGGRSFWRRARLIPFRHQVPDDKVIDNLAALLVGEHGPAVLAWIIDGAVDYINGGLQEPESVMKATRAYRDEQETVARFATECLKFGGGDQVRVPVQRLRAFYERWCNGEDEEAVSAKRLTMDMEKLGAGSAKSGNVRFYTSVTVLSDEQPDPRNPS